MINFKKELIEKRKVLDGNVKIYNSVVRENLDDIKKLFKDSGFKISTERKNNNSLTLQLGTHQYIDEKFKR